MLSVNFAKRWRCLAGVLLVLLTGRAWALDAESMNALANGETNKKIAVIEQLVNAGAAAALPVLEALSAGTLYTTENVHVKGPIRCSIKYSPDPKIMFRVSRSR